MLDNKYIDDAFILHDQTADKAHLNDFFEFVKKTFKDDLDTSDGITKDYLETVKNFKKDDPRKVLNKDWAKFSAFFKHQPMWSIRNYFGETYSFYFAWMGALMSSLWILVFVGLSLFLVGILYEYCSLISISFLNLNSFLYFSKKCY